MAQWDRIDVDGSPMRLYVGMPSLGRAFPAVIVIQHGPGVDRFIEDRVETLSQQGGHQATHGRSLRSAGRRRHRSTRCRLTTRGLGGLLEGDGG